MRGWRSGHGPQAGRGDVRAALLALLAEKPLHGYQLIQEIEQRSGGAWRPSPGSIYPALQLLEDEGLIQSQEADGRRVYQLTDAGKAAVASHHDALAELWQSRRGPRPTAMRELHEMVHHLVAAVSQVARAGSDAEIAQAKEVLVQARKQLYRLLAEGGPTAEQTPPTPKTPPAPTPGSTTL
jgi:DNA-binding PadR family transcriptional regulator